MLSKAITMTVLTHPLQMLLIGMILLRLAREAFGAATTPRPVRPMADLSDLQATTQVAANTPVVFTAEQAQILDRLAAAL